MKRRDDTPADPARRFNAARFTFEMGTGRFSQGSAARYLGISPTLFKQLIDRGQAPPFHQIGKLRIFLREDLDRWIAARRVEPQPGPPIEIRVPSVEKFVLGRHAKRSPIPPCLKEVKDLFELGTNPEEPGVYFLCSAGEVVYVGQSINPIGRIRDHRLSKSFDQAYWMPCRKEDLDKLEQRYINLLTPRLNTANNPRRPVTITLPRPRKPLTTARPQTPNHGHN